MGAPTSRLKTILGLVDFGLTSSIGLKAEGRLFDPAPDHYSDTWLTAP
jgi:hypothetical protein